MAVTFYYGSGSPYAWRVWLALEHKGVPYELKIMSFDSGDLKKPEFLAINPRGRVPTLVVDGFALHEFAAVVEYIEDKWPNGPPLFAPDIETRAVQRRMIREADQYFAAAMERFVDAVLFTAPEKRSGAEIAKALGEIRSEGATWEAAAKQEFLTGTISAADFTLYPCLALVDRVEVRNPGVVPADIFGPNVRGWMERMRKLGVVEKTRPPHWK